MLAGMWIRASARATAVVASLNALPGARLNEIVAATNGPWWLTASGVLPGPYVVTAANGTIVSTLVLTAAPDDALLLPVLASELVAALRAELDAMEAAVVALLLDELVVLEELLLVEPVLVLAVLLPDALELDAVAAVTVPMTAFVVCVPEAVPPDVL